LGLALNPVAGFERLLLTRAAWHPSHQAHRRGGHGAGVHYEPAYLIEHPRGLIMFEAGFHAASANDAAGHIGPLIYHAGLLPMSQQQGQDAISQLKTAGFDPAHVSSVIVSHFHPEHGGAVEAFANADIVVDRREHAYAVGKPAYNYLRNEYDEVKRWRLLDFAGSPPFGPFDGSIDFFGDGSVIVVSTPGHTPGHASLYLRLPQGPVLLAADIAWTQENLKTASIGLPFISVDGPAHRRSLGQLLAFAKAYPYVLLVPGHDIEPLRRASRADIVIHAAP
jgi:N-acyl homoserine lactone hydrolase